MVLVYNFRKVVKFIYFKKKIVSLCKCAPFSYYPIDVIW